MTEEGLNKQWAVDINLAIADVSKDYKQFVICGTTIMINDRIIASGALVAIIDDKGEYIFDLLWFSFFIDLFRELRAWRRKSK